jgi:hypothetical protein
MAEHRRRLCRVCEGLTSNRRLARPVADDQVANPHLWFSTIASPIGRRNTRIVHWISRDSVDE